MNNNEEVRETTRSSDETREVLRFKPRYTSKYTEDAWEVRVALPGVGREDLKIAIEDEILQIEGVRKAEVPETWKRISGFDADRKFELRLDVGPEVDGSGIEAKLKNGELSLRLPLEEASKPRLIPVN